MAKRKASAKTTDAEPEVIGKVMDPDNLRTVSIDSLVGMPGNPRRGPVQDIAHSLDKFEMDQPVVVRESSNVIIKGNHRWQAAKDLGWTHISAYFVDDDEIKSMARGLADNRIADKSAFDMADLKAMMDSLEMSPEEMVLEVPGFDNDYINQVLDRGLFYGDDDDDSEETPSEGRRAQDADDADDNDNLVNVNLLFEHTERDYFMSVVNDIRANTDADTLVESVIVLCDLYKSGKV